VIEKEDCLGAVQANRDTEGDYPDQLLVHATFIDAEALADGASRLAPHSASRGRGRLG
jgi:hypothetical protein